MTDWVPILGGLAIGFACGSVPFGYLLVRLKTGGDVRNLGSGNIGATNVSRALGTGGGVVTLLLDAAKGAVGVLAGTYVGARLSGGAAGIWPWAAALGAVLGHCYTPWLALRGGKGVATLLGAFGVAAPAPTAVAAAALLAVVAATRMMSLASLCGSLVLPAALLAWGYPRSAVAAGMLATVVIYWRHRANIGRIVRGEENRLGGSRA